MANLTPEACRAARALLGLSARELADRSGVAMETINKFENGRPMRESTRAKVAFVLESAGVEILNGDAPGARLRQVASPERVYTDDERAMLASLAKLVDAMDALEDAGIFDLGRDAKAASPEALRQLAADPRWEAIAPTPKEKRG